MASLAPSSACVCSSAVRLQRPAASSSAPSRAVVRARASSSPSDPSRREALLAGLSLSAASALSLVNAADAVAFGDPESYTVFGQRPPGYTLPPIKFQKKSIEFVHKEYARILGEKICELVSADYRDCLRLGFLDSATGGNGSVRFAEELSRPGYEGLAEVVEQYGKVKEAIDAEAKMPVTWADLIAVGGRVKAVEAFKKQYCGLLPRYEKSYQYKAGKGCEDPDTIYTPEFLVDFNNFFQATGDKDISQSPIPLGRKDATEAAPEGLVPTPDAPAAEWIAWSKSKRITLQDLVSISPYLSANGEVDATLREDPKLAKLYEGLVDRKAFFPGPLESAAVKGYAKFVRSNATLDPEAYIVPIYAIGEGWLPRLPVPTPHLTFVDGERQIVQL